ncbi:MAG: hypothetical protein H6739_41810, partial [Alphaproteobacteria bacterium]|nr:hypothetical protein [Alphaproteobacteria bacterium]
LYRIQAGKATTWVLVRQPETGLDLTLSASSLGPDDPLSIDITGEGAGVLSLVGIDARLPATAPDALTARVAGASDAAAMALLAGQRQGENAARAVLLGLGSTHAERPKPRPVSAMAAIQDAPHIQVQLNFGRLERELVRAVQAWSLAAPPEERLTNARFAAIWQDVLDQAEARGEPLVDEAGAPLGPSALVDPLDVVGDPARLPDDLEPWDEWLEAR